ERVRRRRVGGARLRLKFEGRHSCSPVVGLPRAHHQNGSSSGSPLGSSGTSLPVAFHPTILNVGFDLRPYRVIIGAASSATIGMALGCAMRMRAIASPRLITASRPPHELVLYVSASALCGSTK